MEAATLAMFEISLVSFQNAQSNPLLNEWLGEEFRTPLLARLVSGVASLADQGVNEFDS
jgi:hypothetical protein